MCICSMQVSPDRADTKAPNASRYFEEYQENVIICKICLLYFRSLSKLRSSRNNYSRSTLMIISLPCHHLTMAALFDENISYFSLGENEWKHPARINVNSREITHVIALTICFLNDLNSAGVRMVWSIFLWGCMECGCTHLVTKGILHKIRDARTNRKGSSRWLRYLLSLILCNGHGSFPFVSARIYDGNM